MSSHRVLGKKTTRKMNPYDVLVCVGCCTRRTMCVGCSEDPASYQNDESIPHGYNIVVTGGEPYCYDCGESNLKTVKAATKKGFY
jgi:hypothetical protein